MLERWIVKHWIALSAGCLLMAAACGWHMLSVDMQQSEVNGHHSDCVPDRMVY